MIGPLVGKVLLFPHCWWWNVLINISHFSSFYQTFSEFSFEKSIISVEIVGETDVLPSDTCSVEAFDILVAPFHHAVVDVAEPDIAGHDEAQT